MRGSGAWAVQNPTRSLSASISVVIPVFNGGLYIREAVEGFVARTLGDFEVLVVDDGSSDGRPKLFMQGQAALVSSAMFRRTLLDRSGILNEEFENAHLENIDFLSRLAEVTRFLCMPRALVQHRVHRHTTCRRIEGGPVLFEHWCPPAEEDAVEICVGCGATLSFGGRRGRSR